MSTKTKQDNSNLSIIEAVETLSNIADLEFDRDIGIAKTHDVVIQGEPVSYRSVHWLHQKDADQTVRMVRDVFKVILQYLKSFYKKEYGAITNEHTLEGIKTIMVLVGEAAKKLDKYSDFFKDRNVTSATQLKEYKQLQDFYHKKIDRTIDEGILGKWILALTRRTIRERPVKVLSRSRLNQTKHVFVDLDSVKKDTEYELFFMRKEDGSRFFSPRLIRNIKLVCDFGDYFGEEKKEDPLAEITVWQDKYAQLSAKTILKVTYSSIERFFHDTAKIRDHELIAEVKKGVMALLMCANHNNLRSDPLFSKKKGCLEYFTDFQFYLRRALNSHDFQKLLAYPPTKTNKVGSSIVSVLQTICQALFVHLQSYRDLTATTTQILQKTGPENEQNLPLESQQIGKVLQEDYQTLTKLMKQHPNGPLTKVLDLLQEIGHREFDPLIQHNVPNHWFDLFIEDRKIAHLRIPSPTKQEFIHKVSVTDEFKGFLRDCVKSEKTHLLFNLQDRTSWKEHFRSAALEEMQKHGDFKDVLTVVTLPMDTDFYYQLEPYNQASQTTAFIEQLTEHVNDEAGGFFFPAKVQKVVTPEAIAELAQAIHRNFFSNKNVLTREQRLDFIQLFYLFIQLKVIDVVHPDSFSFTCKDGIDVGGSTTVLLFTFLKLLNQEALTVEERDYVRTMTFAPSLYIRERLILNDRFYRMLNPLKIVEHVKEDLGFELFSKRMREEFGKFFKRPVLDGRLAIPKLSVYE